MSDSRIFRKHRNQPPPDFFIAEAAGLRWLAETGAPVVEVLDVGPTHIDLERLPPGRPDAAAAYRFGVALAGMHSAGAHSFGCRPDGFTGQMYVGNQPMAAGDYASWGEFYAATRVLPFAREAHARGHLTVGDWRTVADVCEAINSGAFDDGAHPARIHGDLWNGNVCWTPGGAVMIDPAAHGGHRETDLAMLELFGCPFIDVIEAGYDSVTVLSAGRRDRVGLHQLHPLAVHAVSHGPAYGSELGRTARNVLTLIA